MKNRRWTFASDFHDPLPQAVALLRARQKDLKPDIFIFGGDVVEFNSVTHWVRTRIMENNSPHFLKQETDACFNDVLAPICESLPSSCEKHYIEGNHEQWALQYIASRAAALDGLINLSDILGCKKLGINYVASKKGNGIKTIGPVHFMHGRYCGKYPAAMHLEKFGGPLVVFGHTHKQDYARRKKGNGSDEVAMGVGCMTLHSHEDFNNNTLGFGEGWLNEETGEFGNGFCNISGKNHDYLYLPDAEYSAKCRYDKHGREHWVAERVADSKRKGITTQGF